MNEDDNKQLKEQNFDIDPISFYRMLNPSDIIGRTAKFKEGGALGAFGDSISNDQKLVLYDTYIKNVNTGANIIKTLGPLTNIPTRGVGYQTITIDPAGQATFLDAAYWTTKTIKPSGEIGAGQLITIANYYQFLVDKNSPPDVDVSINVLRMPLLTDVRKNTDEISLFLNYMPSTMASNMVPYLDVEFQMPQMSNELVKDENGIPIKRFLQRPSILRFLLGSVPPDRGTKQSGPLNLLTDSDAALLATVGVPVSQKQLSPTSPSIQGAYIAGMELFTTPQTLTNMDSLREGEGRLNDVKPFLPPAILSSVSISLSNTGLNSSKWLASIELKIPDKARLAEFSEFIRGPSGVSDVTIWITFGWLAPRNATDEDMYAKFINETMLVRYPFTVKNSSFSFESAGIVSLKIDLVGKAVSSLEYGRIDTYADDKKNILRQLPAILAEIKKLRASYSTKKADAAEAVGKPSDNKLYEIFEAAESADWEPKMGIEELLKTLKNEMTRLETEKPEGPNTEKNKQLISRLYYLYEYDPKTKKSKVLSEIEGSSKDFAKKRFDAFRTKLDDDPFLPHDLTVKNHDDPTKTNKMFSTDLVAALEQVKAAFIPKSPAGPTGKAGSSGGGGGGGGGGGKRATPKKDPYVFGTAHGVAGVDGRDTDAKILDYWNSRVLALTSESNAYQISQGGSIDDEIYKTRKAQDIAQLRASRDREREDLRRARPMEPGTGPLAP